MKPQEVLTDTAPTREEEQAEVIRRLEEDIIFGRFAPIAVRALQSLQASPPMAIRPRRSTGWRFSATTAPSNSMGHR